MFHEIAFDAIIGMRILQFPQNLVTLWNSEEMEY